MSLIFKSSFLLLAELETNYSITFRQEIVKLLKDS